MAYGSIGVQLILVLGAFNNDQNHQGPIDVAMRCLGFTVGKSKICRIRQALRMIINITVNCANKKEFKSKLPTTIRSVLTRRSQFYLISIFFFSLSLRSLVFNRVHVRCFLFTATTTKIDKVIMPT